MPLSKNYPVIFRLLELGREEAHSALRNPHGHYGHYGHCRGHRVLSKVQIRQFMEAVTCICYAVRGRTWTFGTYSGYPVFDS